MDYIFSQVKRQFAQVWS